MNATPKLFIVSLIGALVVLGAVGSIGAQPESDVAAILEWPTYAFAQNAVEIIPAGSIDNSSLLLKLDGAHDIATFESDGRTYAAVAARDANGVQILDLTDPHDITPAGSISDDHRLELYKPTSIIAFESGGRTYAAVTAEGGDGVQILDLTNPHDITPAGSISDDSNLKLDTARGIITFESYGRTYAAVTAWGDDGVQILDLTDPHDITPAGSISDDHRLVLDAAHDIAIFESDSRTYVAVAARDANAVQILDLTDPHDITPAGSISDDDNLKLDTTRGIIAFESDGRTYAAVAAVNDDGVQILDLTDPHDITPAGSISDDHRLELDKPTSVITFESGGRTYAAVTAGNDDGVQILDLTDPHDITPAGSISDDDNLELESPPNIAIFESDGRTYAAVTAWNDDGVQILDLTNPHDITPAGSISDDHRLELDGAAGIATFESNGRTYAAVTAWNDDGVQILDLTNPHDITPAGSISDDHRLELDGARDIATFESDGRTYAAVTARSDDGVQILDLTDPHDITPAGSISDDDNLKLDGARDIIIFESDGRTYAAVAAVNDDGVQILDLIGPHDITPAGRSFETRPLPTPLWQVQSGVPANDVECTDDRFLMQSMSGAPVCVFVESISALEERGFVLLDEMVPNVFPMRGGMPATNMVLTSNNCDTQCIATLNSKLDTSSPLTIEFDRFVDRNVDGEEGLYIQYSTDGTIWMTLASYTEDNNQNTDEWVATSLTLDIQQSSASLRFVAKSSTPHEFIEMDNLSIYPKVSDTVVAPRGTPMPSDASDGSGDAGGPLVYGDRPFVTTWKTTNSNEAVIIQLEGSGIAINWGDSHVSDGSTGMFSHFYASPGDYTVSISGGLTRIHLGDADATADKLASVNQWGDASWTNMASSFEGTSHMIYTATDSPDLSRVTDMSGMFAGARSFDGDISSWNVSSVTNMNGMFYDAESFNGNVSGWDVSSVTNMSYMFSAAESFNGNVSHWNVSGVTDMGWMFQNAESFDGDISSWDVSSVTNMSYMFSAAESFNGDVSDWDVSSVTNMSAIFQDTNFFNGDVSHWNVSGVTDMDGVFQDAISFDGDVSHWNVSGVTYMESMFDGATSFNGYIGDWDTSSVTDMSDMFSAAESFDGDISNWNVSSVTNMGRMFWSGTSFDQDISGWDVSSVTNTWWMFRDAESFDGDISGWDVSSVTNMGGMFQNATSFDQDLSGWDIQTGTNMNDMFTNSGMSTLPGWYMG